MNMLDLNGIPNKVGFLPIDKNNREIFIYELNDVVVSSYSLIYPNIIFYSFDLKQHCNLIKEKIMSLEKARLGTQLQDRVVYSKVDLTPYFFFGYNTDNYYHFVYDTLPYLITFFELKRKIPKLKLLCGKPVHGNKHYKFVLELLEVAGVMKEDIEILSTDIMYKKVYASTSFTHDLDSNLPPRSEVYEFMQSLTKDMRDDNSYPRRIYISRRSWLHNDTSNIGTNYTTRRKLINEDELVERLNSRGYKEVFTECLTTTEKLCLFKNAKNIIGAIGGGMCNALFSNSNTKVNVLVSPTFLDVNERFKYCFTNTDITYFTNTSHVEKDEWKQYMRAQHKLSGVIGEVQKIEDNYLTLNYTDEILAGWNNSLSYRTITDFKSNFTKLDNGLNSNWKIDINELDSIL